MVIYKKGSSGESVRRIQQALQDTTYLTDNPDGIFGSRTENAIRNFQKATGLQVDGVVGPETWKRLFPDSEPASHPPSASIESRCLALTGSFETSRLPPDCFAALTGNFDGQGISFGALQWNFGQGTLQPLLLQMINEHYDIIKNIFNENLERLTDAITGEISTALSFADSIHDPDRRRVKREWKDMFTALGRTPEFQEIETSGAITYTKHGKHLCHEYGLWSERGRALMFDICVQNSSIPEKVKIKIEADFQALSYSMSDDEFETAKMEIIANRRAEASNPRFIEDVRSRKLCIARGKGIVHGASYDLASQFGIGLERAI
jgi:hypothetical protein